MHTADAVLQEAYTCHRKGDYARAEYLYDALVAHDEKHAAASILLGELYLQNGAIGRAITFLQRAVQIDPQARGAMENLAAAYKLLEKLDEAKQWNERALAIERTPVCLSNCAGMYINNANPELALKYAEEALSMPYVDGEDWRPAAGNHKALALLEMGRFEEAWPLYDARLDVASFHRRPYKCPRWTGGLVDKLAIHGEQGLGDEIMFMSLFADAEDKYARLVAIECAPRLVKLMQNSFPWAFVYGSHEELIEKFGEPDAYCPMGSLPQHFWPLRKKKPYLKPSQGYPKKRRRIGLSWFGGRMGTHVQLRNTAVEDWKTFLDLPAEVISLQYGEAGEEAAILDIPHDKESIADLDKLAAMVKSCDLVISVCNTTVHMAGALGVPCIVLVPSKPAWRYQLSGETMPFYESCRMVRQLPGEDWKPVLERAKALVDFRQLQAA